MIHPVADRVKTRFGVERVAAEEDGVGGVGRAIGVKRPLLDKSTVHGPLPSNPQSTFRNSQSEGVRSRTAKGS